MSRSPPPDPPIAGRCDARLGAVREAFRENFAREGELGGAVCAVVDGRVVVDLWGGWTDAPGAPGRRPWARDTLVNAYSSGKGPLAMLALAAVESGALDLDAPVARLWPELAAGRRPALTLRALLCHRAGLPAVAAPLPNEALGDWSRMCGALAAQEPWWEPGTDHGYHVNTLGFLVGELLRRATGRPVGALVRERLAGPAGAAFHWGVGRDARHRVATVVLPFETPPRMPPSGDPARDALLHAAYFNPPGFSGFGTVNTAAWRAAVVPSTNAHADARALALLYDAFLRGAAGVGAGLRAEAVRVHADGTDRVLDRPTRFGLGFQLPHARRALGPGPRAFGHFGYGGSLGMADPEAGLAFGYVTNRPGERFRTPRTDRLLEAVYAGLAT